MPRSYKCTAEITVHTVKAPGTWLPNRDDVYLTIELFNQVKRTRLTDPIFPLTFHDRFSFEKIFWMASDPLEVTEILEDLSVVVELRQVTDVYLGGALLAYFDSNAKELLSPYPTTSSRLEKGRELIMCRTVDFTGISPKLEFTTYTIIEEYNNSYLRSTNEPYLGETLRPTDFHRSPFEAKHVQPRSSISGGYDRQTISSVLRSCSPSPMDFGISDNQTISQAADSRHRKKRLSAAVEIRPPFVVRKVDPGILLRKPKLHDNYNGLLVSAHKRRQKRRSRSASPSRLQGVSSIQREQFITPRISCEVCNMTNDTDLALKDMNNVPPEPPKIKVTEELSGIKPSHDTRNNYIHSSDDNEEVDDDREVANINHRSNSPATYYPSLRDRYPSILHSTSKNISQRVHNAQLINSSFTVF